MLHKSDKADEAAQQLADFVKASWPQGESGLVYVLTRKDAEQLSAVLRARGVSAVHYHAGRIRGRGGGLLGGGVSV